MEKTSEIEDKFQGLSRRQVIRKVGLATMITLPVISSLIAPTAAMAQSGGLPQGSACTSSPQCSSGPVCNSTNTCCAAGTTGNAAPGQQVFAPTGTCGTPVGSANCCSGNSFFNGTLNATTDICRCT